MFIDLTKRLPFFGPEGGAGGNTSDDTAGNNGKGKTEEPDDYLAKIEKDLDDSRNKIFAEEEAEGVKSEEAAETKQPAAPSKIEGLQTIDDSFISGSTTSELFKGIDHAEVVKVLNGIKGSQIDAKALKNYVHAQVKLEEYQRAKGPEKIENENQDENFDNFQDRSVEDNLAQLDDAAKEKLSQAKVYALYNKLKGKYKDLTLEDLQNEDSLNEYVSTLQVNKPLQADDFKADLRKSNTQIDKETNEYVDRAVNFGDYMRKDAKEMVDKFTAQLVARGIDPKELETNFDEKWIVQNIVKKADGKLNTDMIGYYRNDRSIPILNKQVFFQALLEKFDPRIVELTKKAGINEYINGKRKKEANPSISSSEASGSRKIETEDFEKPISQTDFPGFENIEKTLAANRKRIFESAD